MPLSIGDKLGPYEILAPIGAGGMGEVYKACDTRLDRIVAIKVSKTEFSERFEREAHAVAALNHPNICQLYDVGPNYLVMEYVEGAPLKGPLPLEQAQKYAVQICDALDAAHKKGVTHRDLKPANILATKTGIKLLDFGLAKLGSAGTGQAAKPPDDATLTMALTGRNEIVGTLYYMSPEQLQAQANGQEIDARSDIFSFGLVLYEMLTGKRAFEGSSPASVIAAIMERPAPSIATIAPPALDRLLQRCLAKDPDDRWQTARDLKAELGWISSASGEATSVRTTVARHRLLPWIAAAIAIAVAAGASWIAYRAARPVEQPLTRFSVDLGPEAVAGARITAAISPDGRRLAFVARGAGGKEQLATRLLDQANPAFLAGTENATDPFFSPDSQWIGFFADNKMKKISVASGAAVTLCDAPGARGASWGEGGNIVVTLNSTTVTGLSRVSAAGGTPQTLTKPADKNEFSHRWPQILPGGEAVLFTSSTRGGAYDDASIAVLSLKTGQWKTVQRGGYFGRYLATSNRAGQLVYVHQGTLLGAPFDLDRLEVRGTPSPLLEDVAGDPDTGGGQFDVSRNGTFVYLGGKSSVAGWPLVWLDSTGKTEPLLASPGNYVTPRLSPDGKRLAVSVNTNAIGVYDSQRDTMTPLTFKPQFVVFPVWTPDGKHIVFSAGVSAGTTLQWVRSDGAGETQPLLESKQDILRPYSFSPDGKRLAFAQSSADTGYDLWTLPLDLSDPEHPKAGKPELFLRTTTDEYEPAFSPDGRWIAYRSSATGVNEVYVQPFPGPIGKWLISSGGGRHPIWSRNGRELFYQALDYRIMVVTYTAKGDSLAADRPRPWAATQILESNGLYWNLDLAPDGKRFVVAPRAEATGEQKGSVHVTVLLNFFDELRRRVPTGK